MVYNRSGKILNKDISRNIETVFLKLGTTNVRHKQNKMTPAVLLPWQFAACPVLVKTEIPSIGLNWGSFTPANLMMRIW